MLVKKINNTNMIQHYIGINGTPVSINPGCCAWVEYANTFSSVYYSKEKIDKLMSLTLKGFLDPDLGMLLVKGAD